jgi:hypothetical protein
MNIAYFVPGSFCLNQYAGRKTGREAAETQLSPPFVVWKTSYFVCKFITVC